MTNENTTFRPLDSLQLMAYIIERCRALDINVNATKLQKLMYCCYGVALASLNLRLCGESPEAWQYGPVFPRTLLALKNNGLDGFSEMVRPPEKKLIDANVEAVIDQTLNFFGEFTANQLSSWSHLKGSPWSRASNDGKDLYGQIDDSSIRAYFRANVIGHPTTVSQPAR